MLFARLNRYPSVWLLGLDMYLLALSPLLFLPSFLLLCVCLVCICLPIKGASMLEVVNTCA